MSDDEGDVDTPLPPVEDSNLDADGYHVVSNRGKFADRSNPLLEKLREEKRKAEIRAAEEAKKAKLASKLAAFGGGVQKKDDGSTTPSGAGEGAKKATTPSASRPLDKKVTEMMNSGIVTQKPKPLLASRGRGRGVPVVRGRSEDETPKESPTSEGTAPEPQMSDSDASTDSEEEARRRVAAKKRVEEAKAAVRIPASPITSPLSSPTNAFMPPLPTPKHVDNPKFPPAPISRPPSTSVVPPPPHPPPPPAIEPKENEKVAAVEGKRRATLLVVSCRPPIFFYITHCFM
jgi:hypothetical protein